MGILDRKLPQQIELEKKIQTLRSGGMTSSADRMEQQLRAYLRAHGEGSTEKIRPMSQKQLVKTVREQKALAGKS